MTIPPIHWISKYFNLLYRFWSRDIECVRECVGGDVQRLQMWGHGKKKNNENEWINKCLSWEEINSTGDTFP